MWSWGRCVSRLDDRQTEGIDEPVRVRARAPWPGVEDRTIAQQVFGDDLDLLALTGSNLWKELLRRSKDEKVVRQLDMGQLVRMTDLIARVVHAREPKARPSAAEPDWSVADILAGVEGMPEGRRRELILKYRQQLADDISELDRELERAVQE